MATTQLYVGNLSYQTTEEELRQLFSTYGKVVSARIVQGKGFGFVEIEGEEEAKRAKEGLNATDLRGRTIRVDEARPRQDGPRGGGGGG
ncbi:MAG: RNA-binding protein, partial [Candidatus Tectomicrobia bacterium]|nr:RNA-binding protein [Candidatus Tectomicrobia bacterium]